MSELIYNVILFTCAITAGSRLSRTVIRVLLLLQRNYTAKEICRTVLIRCRSVVAASFLSADYPFNAVVSYGSS